MNDILAKRVGEQFLTLKVLFHSHFADLLLSEFVLFWFAIKIFDHQLFYVLMRDIAQYYIPQYLQLPHP